jgi:hypothetical protein
MALDFYVFDDAFLEKDHWSYLAYFHLEMPARIDAMEVREYDFLTPWVRRCEAEGLGVTHFFCRHAAPEYGCAAGNRGAGAGLWSNDRADAVWAGSREPQQSLPSYACDFMPFASRLWHLGAV